MLLFVLPLLLSVGFILSARAPSTGAGRAGTRPAWRRRPPSTPRRWCRSMPRGPGAGRGRSRSIPGSSSSPRGPRATTATRWSAGAWARARPSVRRNLRPPDGRWAGNDPSCWPTCAGRRRQALIPEIEAAIARYPYPDRLRHLARAELEHVRGLDRPRGARAAADPAVDRDRQGLPGRPARGPHAQRHRLPALAWAACSASPSGVEEGLELNLLGLVLGVDPKRLGDQAAGPGPARMG